MPDMSAGVAPSSGGKPNLPIFPSAAWRGLFARYRDLVAPTTEAAEALLFGAFMCALSFLVGRSVTLPWGSGRMPPVLHAVVLGTSAKGRKSTALDDAVDIVAEPLMPKAAQDGEPDPAQVITGLGSGEGFAEAIADQMWRPPGDEEREDPPETQTGRRGIFVVHEVAALLDKIARGQAGAMEDFMLAAFDARSKWSHRTRNGRESKPLTITNGVAIFLGASTYAWLAEKLTDTQVMAGLVNRILWFAGPRSRSLPIRPRIPQDMIAALQDDITKALLWVRGKECSLSEEATVRHAAFYAEEQEKPGESEVADAAVARSDVLALRLAMLLAIADCTTIIGTEHVEAAWAVVRYSQTVVLGLVAQIHERTMREAEARVLGAARRIAERNGGEFTRRKVRENLKGKTGMDAETFLRAWNALVAAEDIQAVPRPDTFILGAPRPRRDTVARGDLGDWGTGGLGGCPQRPTRRPCGSSAVLAPQPTVGRLRDPSESTPARAATHWLHERPREQPSTRLPTFLPTASWRSLKARFESVSGRPRAT